MQTDGNGLGASGWTSGRDERLFRPDGGMWVWNVGDTNKTGGREIIFFGGFKIGPCLEVQEHRQGQELAGRGVYLPTHRDETAISVWVVEGCS
jgi:hypothetical protein